MAEPIALVSSAQRAEAIAVLCESFVGPVPSPLPPGVAWVTRRFSEATTRMVGGAYGSAKDARWYGLVVDGRLVSAALLTNARARLTPRSYFVMARYGLEILCLGWPALLWIVREVSVWPPDQQKAVTAAYSPRPGFQELHLIATVPAIQGRGYGDRLLTFLRAEARARGYSGLALTTVREWPAYNWYLRHGFVSEIEFSLLGVAVCRMVLSDAEPATSQSEEAAAPPFIPADIRSNARAGILYEIDEKAKAVYSPLSQLSTRWATFSGVKPNSSTSAW